MCVRIDEAPGVVLSRAARANKRSSALDSRRQLLATWVAHDLDHLMQIARVIG